MARSRSAGRRGDVLARLLAACGAFLTAVLWMDLLFDVQTLALDGTTGTDARPLASIAAYYRRVTTDAFPMNRLIGAVMAVTVLGALWRTLRSRGRGWTALLPAALASGAVGLALLRVLPNAVRLGAAADPAAVQTDLARSIFRDHVLCLAAMVAFTALQLGGRERTDG